MCIPHLFTSSCRVLHLLITSHILHFVFLSLLLTDLQHIFQTIADSKIVWQPRLDHARYSSSWSLSQRRGMQAFSVIQTTPLPPPKKRLADYFQSAKGMSRRGTSYFLQKYNPRLVAAASRSSFDDCTAGELSSLNDRASLVPLLVILSQKAKAHAVLWTKRTLLPRNWMFWNMLGYTRNQRLHTILTYPRTTIWGWKGPAAKR